MSNPELSPDARQLLVDQLMAARRGVRSARQAGDVSAEAMAKRALGERGPVWWTDGAPDFNRHMARTTPYAAWFASTRDDQP
jgi:ABC-type sugar transport system substrate-binding protein